MTGLVAAMVLASSFPKNVRPLIGHVFPGITSAEECEKLFGPALHTTGAHPGSSWFWRIAGTKLVVHVDGFIGMKIRPGRELEEFEILPAVFGDKKEARAPLISPAKLSAGIVDLRWIGRSKKTVLAALTARKLRTKKTDKGLSFSVLVTGNRNYKRYEVDLTFKADTLQSIGAYLGN